MKLVPHMSKGDTPDEALSDALSEVSSDAIGGGIEILTELVPTPNGYIAIVTEVKNEGHTGGRQIRASTNQIEKSQPSHEEYENQKRYERLPLGNFEELHPSALESPLVGVNSAKAIAFGLPQFELYLEEQSEKLQYVVSAENPFNEQAEVEHHIMSTPEPNTKTNKEPAPL